MKMTKRNPNCGLQCTVEESFDTNFQPLVQELLEQGASFPKSVVYTKLKWCGYGHEAAVKDCSDEKIMRRVAQPQTLYYENA